jgi:hypothetical protein
MNKDHPSSKNIKKPKKTSIMRPESKNRIEIIDKNDKMMKLKLEIIN